MSRLIFIADADYEGRTESELTFRAGESIRILKNDGDWWFGESKVTGCQGWVAPSYGHTMAESSPYSKLSDNEKVKKRKPLWNNILSSHEQFLKAMKSLNEIIISPLMLRDDSFKRSFVDDPDIALGFSLLSELYITCRNFSVVLSKAVADAEIAHAYLQFSPSLQVFAQYIAGNSKLVNAVQSKQKLLKDFLKTNILPDKLTLEACLFLPLEHYPKYKEEFQEFVWLTPVSSSATGVLNDALDSLIAMTDYVDVKLQEEAQSLLVLKIQNQCMYMDLLTVAYNKIFKSLKFFNLFAFVFVVLGRAPIYTPTRRILREGEIERVRINSKNEVTLKTHYAHLFNDALIYSVRNVIGYYRLHYAFDLRDAVLRKSDGAGLSNTFTIATPEKTEIFRFPTEEETSIWFSLLEDQIRQLKTVNKIAKRTSMITKANFLPGVKVSALGGRGQLIYRFLQSEIQFAEAMSMMNIAVIQPLLDASNGAKLTAVKVSTKSYTNEMGDSSINIREAAVNGDALFGKSTTTISNYQAAAITDALRAADVQIFLRASEGIASSLRDFVESLETACNKVEWKDDSLALGKAFSSVSALGLYNQFKSYASGQQAALRVLKTSNFEQFYKECEVNLAATPGSLQDKIEIPRNRIAHYLTFVSNLLQSTTEGHTDFQPLVDAQKKLTTTKDDVDEVIRLKKNFEILLEIQNSLVSLSVGSADPILSKIASMDRTFIKDGDLKKVCRKANKTFRFWLFNDYLLYGAAMGGGKYSFHRALDLKKCNVGIHTGSHKNALEIYGAEKSFVVIAKTDTVRNEWFEAIKIAREALGVASSAAAPLWKPDHNADACHVCGQVELSGMP